MNKQEIKKEFDDLCDIDKQHPKMVEVGRYVSEGYLFDWFWSKLEEKDKEMEQLIEIHHEQADELQAKLKAADEVISNIHVEIEWPVLKYNSTETINSPRIKLMYKDESIIKALEHYKSLKP